MRGKTRYLQGKDATRGLKPESHLSNYKYKRKNIFIMPGNGGGCKVKSASLACSPMGEKSNLRSL